MVNTAGAGLEDLPASNPVIQSFGCVLPSCRRADLGLLEYKQEVCLKEVMGLEQELSVLRRQGRQYGAVQVEVRKDAHLGGISLFPSARDTPCH